jgi:3-dehydroquinate dehydratase
MTQVATGTIAGLGVHGYELAVAHLIHRHSAVSR